MTSSNQDFWAAKFSSTVRYDSVVLREPHELKWKTMLVWEYRLEKNTIATINRVANCLSQNKTASDTSSGLGITRVNGKELIRTSEEKVRSRTRTRSCSASVLAASAGSMSLGFYKHPSFQIIVTADPELGKQSSGKGKLSCKSSHNSINISTFVIDFLGLI